MVNPALSALAVGLGAIALATAAEAQSFARPPDEWFQVSWERESGAPTIGGWVHNDSPFLVTNVHLRIEGFDPERRPIGETRGWALGDIVPGSQTSFVAPSVPGANTYRITVEAFDLVSQGR